MLGSAIALASKVFEGKFDKGGNPYILHCLQVMYWVDQSDSELMQIAVLHDVLEDIDYLNSNDLKGMGFSNRVLSALDCLTHRDGEPYEAYISRVALNRDAIEVKLADLRHNSDILRMKGLRDKDFKRLEKYHRSFSYLTMIKSLSPNDRIIPFTLG